MKNLPYILLFVISLPALRATENLLPPLSVGASRAGDPVASPWLSSDASDDGLVSVKLGSPHNDKADWAKIKDESPINTANLRYLKLPSVSRGELSFEIHIADGADGSVAISLGIDGVTDTATRIISLRFLPDGRIQLSSHDTDDQTASTSYTIGQNKTYQLKFNADDNGRGTIQLFEDGETSPIAELKTTTPLVPITGLRVTTGQKNSHVLTHVRNLTLTAN